MLIGEALLNSIHTGDADSPEIPGPFATTSHRNEFANQRQERGPPIWHYWKVWHLWTEVCSGCGVQAEEENLRSADSSCRAGTRIQGEGRTALFDVRNARKGGRNNVTCLSGRAPDSISISLFTEKGYVRCPASPAVFGKQTNLRKLREQVHFKCVKRASVETTDFTRSLRLKPPPPISTRLSESTSSASIFLGGLSNGTSNRSWF